MATVQATLINVTDQSTIDQYDPDEPRKGR